MKQEFAEHFHSEEEELMSSLDTSHKQGQNTSKWFENQSKERYLDPPRELPKRSYSLLPDMANGWKPKRNCRANLGNVFPINYSESIVDEIVKELYRKKPKTKDRLIYLGPRRSNSYLLHQEKQYQNPYPIDKKMDQLFSGRPGLPIHPKIEQECLFKFDSNFESGNLDAVIEKGPSQFDLFLRADSNTRGHTNWFFFSVSNSQFVGTVKLNICNFRRQKSLYQRGLKPYVFSRLQDTEWHQGGKSVSYQRQRPKYSFLYEDEDEDRYMYNIFLTK